MSPTIGSTRTQRSGIRSSQQGSHHQGRCHRSALFLCSAFDTVDPYSEHCWRAHESSDDLSPRRSVTLTNRLLYGGAVFLAAFLLFLVEPVAAKQLLPS